MDEEYFLLRENGCLGQHRIFSATNIYEIARVAVLYSKIGEVSLEVVRDSRYLSGDELERIKKNIENIINEQ